MRDEQLTKRFAELRAMDRMQTPTLNAVLMRRAKSATGRHRPLTLVLATAGAVLIAAGIWNRSQIAPPPTVAEILAWQPPTDAFLLPVDSLGDFR